MKLTGLNSWKSWGVAVGVSFVNCLVLLPLRISGLLYIEWMPRYNSNRKNAVEPIIVSYLLRCLCGPLIGFLLEIVEIRTIYTVGSLFAASGIGICFFAERTTFLIAFFGVLYGLGFAAINSLMPQVIKQHFDMHVTKANGVTYIATCASSLFILPVAEFCLKTFGVTETFLIMSGTMLQAVPISMLLRDPKYNQRTIPQVNDSTSKEYRPPTSEESHSDRNISSYRTGKESVQNEKPLLTMDGEPKSDQVIYKVSYKTNDSDDTCEKNETVSEVNLDVKLEGVKTKTENSYQYRLVSNNDLEDSASEKNQDDSVNKPLNLISGTNSNKHSSSSCSKTNKCAAAFHSLHVLVYPPYLSIMISYSFLAFIVTVTPAIIIDAALDKGISESKGMYFLMFIPLAELAGSLTLGWVVDRGYLSASNLTAVSFFCLVLACFSLAWASAFHALIIGTLCIGFFSYNIFVISPALVYEFVDETQQSVAITSRMLLFVPLSFATGPLIGYFRGAMGSYDWIFYIMAIGCGACTVLNFFLPHLARCYSFKQKAVKKV